ncbi:MAG: hypothetical protein OEW58_04660 [Gammaproteobacteria bacterium]|nr:hypothetical protein [Gammaproteobacteria bacterium]
MKVLVLTLAVLVGGSALAVFLRQDPGHVLISYQKYTVEMSLVLFVILTVLTVLLLYVVVTVVNNIRLGPERYRKWRAQRNQQRAYDTLNKGLLASAEGEWKKAEKNLLAYVKDSNNPRTAYLAAAKAAQAQGAAERRDEYLKLAHQFAGGDDAAVDMIRAELQIDSGEWNEAQTLLERLRQRYPKNSHVLLLLISVYEQLSNWEAMLVLLPELYRRKVLPETRLQELERLAYQGKLIAASNAEDTTELTNVWEAIPKRWREDAAVLGRYLRYVIVRGDMEQAESLLRASLAQQWNEQLVYLFGLLHLPNAPQALGWMEKTLLPGHQGDTVLLQALGRVAMQARLWGKARTYLEAATRQGAEPEIYFNLATVLEKLDNTDAARECYRKGLAAASQQREKLVLKS